MTLHDQIKLLPCPFCGGEARIALGEHDFNGAQIECKECYASGCHHSDDKHGEAAADSWNARHAAAELALASDARIAELEKENAALRRGEFICAKCGLRQDSTNEHEHNF